MNQYHKRILYLENVAFYFCFIQKPRGDLVLEIN